jgi:RNA polymerase sigma factor (sigma-70 family)
MSCDERDFQRIYETYRPRIERYLTRMINEYEAEDLTQEVLVKISQALPSFRGESQLSAWIYRIATNAVIDRMRTVSYRQDAQSGPLDDAMGLRTMRSGSGKGSPRPTSVSCARKGTSASSRLFSICRQATGPSSSWPSWRSSAIGRLRRSWG